MKKVLVILCTIIVAGCYSKKPEIKKTGLEGKLMPVIDLIAIDGMTHFSTESIQSGKPTVLFAFEPWCPFCKAQTTSMIAQIQKLKNINIYMLCTSDYSLFKAFYTKFQLQKYPNIKAGIDYQKTFANYFEQSTVPFLAIYNSEKKLKQVMKGKSYIGSIKEAASNEK
jgi:thiol-disulfide isomerase/thioredoxin